MPDLKTLLPSLLPLAIDWAQSESARILRDGRALDPAELRIARAVGVADPGRIRVLAFTELPWPSNPWLRRAAMQAGLLGPGTEGLTLGHGILLREGSTMPGLLAHECRHCQQFESFGSMPAFLAEYLRQIVEVGYRNAPLEQDARAHESPRT